jgi:uncharacterized protein YfaS (alpha-2-macroglobulin family)
METESTLEIRVSGKVAGMRTAVEHVTIPELHRFKLLSAEVIAEPEYGVQLTFSSPVSETQDLKGMIRLDGISTFVTQVKDNKVNLFFERKNNAGMLAIHIDQGLKSSADEPLKNATSVSLELTLPAPKVEFLSSGSILPNAKSLLLPFRSVSLRAVDVKVFHIYESNILMFLQSNTWSTSHDLRRAGRLVYRKTFRLDSNPSKKQTGGWENHTFDLSRMFKREPGAVYRVELSFKQHYAAYPCENRSQDNMPALSSALTDIGEGVTDNDETVWDTPQTYYNSYYDEWDWSSYDWEERDNPCHPSYYMNYERMAAVNVLASDLGLIVKSNASNQLWVAVSNLVDAKPVANAEVTAYNFQLQPVGTARTDENGFVVFQTKNKPFAVVASALGQKTYLKVTDGAENLLSNFDVGGKETRKGLKGYIYGERGVWRPGDTLHLSFMLEDRERRIPATHPVSLEIFNPRGQFHQKQVSVNGLNGLYTFAVPTQADDPTGLWSAFVKVGSATFNKSLRIEAVKPNRLKINMDIPDQLKAGDVSLKLRSAWLTGATARNLKAKVEMSLAKTTTRFDGYEPYIFNNPAVDFTSDVQSLFEGTLNEQGEVAFFAKIPEAQHAPGMLRADLISRVFEQGGDASIYYKTVSFSPFKRYVGINFNQKPSERYIETDTDRLFDVVTLSADGKPVDAPLAYRIYRIGWSWWWGYEEQSYASYLQNTSVEPVASGKLQTSGGKAQLKFRIDYPDWGSYLVYVEDAEGGHATGGRIYVDWPDWRGRSERKNPDNVQALALSTDRTSYESGEQATIIIPASSGSRALVAVENGTEVLSREWITAPDSGDIRYRLPITDAMAPNVFVHVSLLQPHEQTANDLPIRMYGVTPVLVINKNSMLTPQIAMPDVLQPEMDFTVKVKEAAGKPMTYTLAIVDDGLLDLTNFKTPDPWNEFYSREALGIRTWDLYDDVIGSFAGKYGNIFGIGGDSELRQGSEKANRFKPVVTFIGPFDLRKGEEKTHSLRLPSYIGSVRVMVVAGQNGAYGNAEKTVSVRTPLMLLSTLPRVVSTDEEIALPVNVFAMEPEVKHVTVKVETTGKLRLSGEQQQAIAFTSPGDRTVYFNLKSDAAVGVEKVTVTVTGNGHTAKETIEINVRNPNPPVIRSDVKMLDPGASAELTYRLDGNYAGNWVKLEAARIPSVDLSRRFDYLHDYPHYCSEQLTSCALPLLFVPQFKDMDASEAETVKKNIRQAIVNLYGRQLSNGGIVYWPGDSDANLWITSYAGSFLVMAKEKGYDVNEGVLARWRSFQRNHAQNWTPERRDNKRYYYYYDSAFEQAYRLYTLALAGTPEIGAMNRLKELKDLSVQARWRLAAAYALAGKTTAAGELLLNASTTVEPYSPYNNTYGSFLRDEAMILETLLLMGRDKEAFTHAQQVARTLSGDQSCTTQSTAYALMAMGRLAEKMSGTLQFAWTLNKTNQPAVKSARAVFQKDLPLQPLSGQVTVKNEGEGVLYVNLTSKTRPLRDTLPPVAHNLRLEVSYTDPGGAPVDAANLRQGTDFIAVVRVSNISGTNNYTDLALTHLIPSGWEIFNERMQQPDREDMQQTSCLYRDIRDDGVLTYFDLSPGERKEFKVRLQASYAGDFILPAIQCEAMYDTEVQARTQAGRVRVTKTP